MARCAGTKIEHLLVVAAILSAPKVRGQVGGIDQIPNSLGRGNVRVHVPASYDPAVPTPLIVLLHGATSTGQGQENYMQFGRLVDEFGFLYVHPDGSTPAGGGWRWATAQDEIDSHRLAELITAIKAQFNVDPKRVYLVGHSNGGGMTYRMVCNHGDQIAAVAVLGAVANIRTQTGRFPPTEANCVPATVFVLHIAGSNDVIADYETVTEELVAWARDYGCAPTWQGAEPGCVQGPGRRGGDRTGTTPCDTSLGELDLDTSLARSETVITQWVDGCRLGGSVELWTIRGGVHVPALSSNFSRAVVEWLFAHPKADCNGNGVPDEADVAEGTSLDCNANAHPDECELDCNGNGVHDLCDVAAETSRDWNGNEVPDECELFLFGDFDRDGDIDLTDFLFLSECFTGPGDEPTGFACCRRINRTHPCNSPADLDGDADVDLADIALFIGSFTGPR